VSGLYWLGARYYDSVAGRFLGADPLGHDGDPSLYGFCNGDPINYFDPDGRMGKQVGNFAYNGGLAAYGLRELGGYLDTYQSSSAAGGWFTGLAGTLVNEAAGAVAPSTYVNGLVGFGNNVGTIYSEGGLLPAASYAVSGWNVGQVYSGLANLDLVTGGEVGDWYERGAAISGGVASTTGIAAAGLGGLGALGEGGAAPAGGTLWQNRFPGTQVRQVGDYWVKRVNPESSELMQAWGQRTIQAQAEALETLRAAGRPAANSRLFESGRLVVEDVGTPLSSWNYLNPQYWRAWYQDTRALGTPINDLRPGNYGPRFRAFDPALDPIQSGIIGGAGLGIYYGVGQALSGGNQ